MLEREKVGNKNAGVKIESLVLAVSFIFLAAFAAYSDIPYESSLTEQNKFFSSNYQQSIDKFTTALQTFKEARVEQSSAVQDTVGEMTLGKEEDGFKIVYGYFGDSDATKVVVLTAGVHGAEAYAGMAFMGFWLERLVENGLEPGVSYLFIGPINPFGAKYLWRPTADNVDLNRNFIPHFGDFTHLNFNKDYGFYYANLIERKHLLEGNPFGKACFLFQILQKVAQKGGTDHLMETNALGQYSHSRGIFYGGTQLTENNRVVAGLLRLYCDGKNKVFHFDIHTGIGTQYHASLMPSVKHPSEKLNAMFKAAPETMHLVNPDNSHGNIVANGDTIDAIPQLFQDSPSMEITSATVEIGTRPGSISCKIEDIFTLIDANHLLTHRQKYGLDCENGGEGSFQKGPRRVREKIRKHIERLYNPAEKKWQDSVVSHAWTLYDMVRAYLRTHRSDQLPSDF